MFARSMKHLTVVLLMLALLLAGCSSAAPSGTGETDSAANQDSTPAESTDSADKEPAKEPVTIKLHNWYVKKVDNWDQVIAEFEKKYPNIKVEFVSAEDNNSNEYLKKLDLAAASGEDLDVIMFNSMTYHVQRVELGMMEPLDSYLEKEGVVLTDEYTVDTRINGKTYGLPGKSVSPFVMINESHMKDAGLAVPKDWTWDEFMDFAKKLTKTENGKTRYGTYFHIWPQFQYLVQINQPSNPNLTTDDGKTANVDNPFMRKSLEMRLTGDKEGWATPYAEVISQKLNYRPQYFNQDTSMLFMYSYMIPEAGGSDAVPANFKTVFAPLPKVNSSDKIIGNIGSDILGIYSKSKHKEEAYTFIRWFTTEGIVLQGKAVPSWKKANMEQVLDKIIAGTKTPEMIDKESLLYVMENTIPNSPAVAVPYHAELEKILGEEFDKMMLSGQDMETTIKTAQDKMQKVIDSKQ
jgi:multiple sugar transport system substrate-binding protein